MAMAGRAPPMPGELARGRAAAGSVRAAAEAGHGGDAVASTSAPPSPRTQPWTADEDFPVALLHLVERPDLRHPGLDLALWRARRRRRVRQPLFSHPRRQDRRRARLRAALGDL